MGEEVAEVKAYELYIVEHCEEVLPFLPYSSTVCEVNSRKEKTWLWISFAEWSKKLKSLVRREGQEGRREDTIERYRREEGPIG